MHTHPLRFLALSIVVISVAVVAGVRFSNAQVAGVPGLNLAFGGKVVSTVNPAIVCTNTEGGPLMIVPVRGTYPPGPYATTLTTKRYSNFIITPGTWIIGLYSPVPDASTCINPQTGAPVPVLPIKIYGVSKALGF